MPAITARPTGCWTPTATPTAMATSDVNSASSDRGRLNLPGSTTVAKIALNDDDNVRGYDLTVTGSGFNNGVTADVYVLSGNDAVWDTLNCAQMNLAVGQMGDDMDTEGNGFCRMYADMTAAEKDALWTIWTSATIRPKLRFARASSPKAPTPATALWAATTRSPSPLR